MDTLSLYCLNVISLKVTKTISGFVNFGKLIYKSDPFVFATQVKQVYYTEDPTDNWQVVTKISPKYLFDVNEILRMMIWKTT